MTISDFTIGSDKIIKTDIRKGIKTMQAVTPSREYRVSEAIARNAVQACLERSSEKPLFPDDLVGGSHEEWQALPTVSRIGPR